MVVDVAQQSVETVALYSRSQDWNFSVWRRRRVPAVKVAVIGCGGANGSRPPITAEHGRHSGSQEGPWLPSKPHRMRLEGLKRGPRIVMLQVPN
jgi:hypothetical protein